MWKTTSPMMRLWLKLVLIMTPVVIVLGIVSYWLTIFLIGYSRSFQFVGVFPLLIGSGLVFHSIFTPDLKRMAEERARKMVDDDA